jgi:hypothetical protein
MARLYQYVGPPEIRLQAEKTSSGIVITTSEQLNRWIALADDRKSGESVTATFVIDIDGQLRLADRHSELVAASAGQAVMSAGEITFVRRGNRIRIEEVTNQSTGFCPEPESWTAVEAALNQFGVEHPGGFALECIFRRCPACNQINLVKDGWFVCAVCQRELPSDWNLS